MHGAVGECSTMLDRGSWRLHLALIRAGRNILSCFDINGTARQLAIPSPSLWSYHTFLTAVDAFNSQDEFPEAPPAFTTPLLHNGSVDSCLKGLRDIALAFYVRSEGSLTSSAKPNWLVTIFFITSFKRIE